MTTPMTAIFSPRYRRGERPGNEPESQPPGVRLAALPSGRSEKTFRAKARAKRKERMTAYFS